jgi:hypothetical protein
LVQEKEWVVVATEWAQVLELASELEAVVTIVDGALETG